MLDEHGKLHMMETRKLLPVIERWDRTYSRCLYAAKTNDDVIAAGERYSKKLERVVRAIHADTSHVNRLDTLLTAFAAGATVPRFGVSPLATVRAFVRQVEGLAYDAPL